MRKSTQILAIMAISVLQTTIGVAGNKRNKDADTTKCLQVIGLAIEKSDALDGANIKLYKENEWLEEEEITSVVYHEHSFAFDLIKDAYYTIEISKPGYTTRLIAFSTKMPKNFDISGKQFLFEFDIHLVKEKKEEENFYQDFPCAIIEFNEKKEVFESSSKYEKNIKEKLYAHTIHQL